MIGLGTSGRDFIEREFREARNHRVGCGFITCELARQPAYFSTRPCRSRRRLCCLSFGDPSPFIP